MGISIRIAAKQERGIPEGTTRLPFGTTFSDHMLTVVYRDGGWRDAEIRPYSAMPLAPSINALQYGLAVFEGLKAFRTVAGDVALFRPDRNHERLSRSCRRLVLPEVPREIFVEGLRQLVAVDAGWVPAPDEGSLYVRPCVFATDENIRVKPAETCVFVVFTCPVGAYFNKPLSLTTSEPFVRAFPGGTGDVKPAGNYAAGMLAERRAQTEGFDAVLWLDAKDHRYVEECGVMNVFFVLDGTVVTPGLTGTILAGVTRDSVIHILRDMGVRVDERPVPIEEIIDRHGAGEVQECFGTGTAATIAQVERIRHRGDDLVLPPVEGRPIASAALERLDLIRTGRIVAPPGWLEPVLPVT
jgi:branched-chain amino acid aminotransferase